MNTGRVYKIISGQSNECYVGSTFNELRHRFMQHKNHYKRWKKGKRPSKVQSYELFEKYGVGSCKIILIKEYVVADRQHLEMYEALWIYKLKSINKNIPFGNKIRKLRNEGKKLHYQINKHIIIPARADYRKEWYRNNKERHNTATREWNRNNKERFAVLTKNHYEKNKEKLNARRGEKIPCEKCEAVIRRDSSPRHNRKFHQR